MSTDGREANAVQRSGEKDATVRGSSTEDALTNENTARVDKGVVGAGIATTTSGPGTAFPNGMS